MEHPHVMQHQHQYRTPIQSHDHLPQQQQRPSPRRPSSSSRGRIYRGEESGVGGGGGSENHQHPGHIMQSRTTSSAHVLSKRARSRSKGRRRRKEHQERQQPHQQGRPSVDGGGGGRRTSQESSFHDSTHGHRFSEEANDTSFGSSQINNVTELVRDGKINEYGRCIRHPTIELCCQDSKNSPWRVLLQDCPLCSLDDSGLASLRPETNNHRMSHDGGSQATSTPSTKTNRTLTTEEESSVKSWTMSDGSTSENEDNISTTASTATREQLFIPRPPPKHPSNFMAPPPQDHNSLHRGSNHQTQQQQNSYYQNNNPTIFDPVQSLKELGRKLVMESEQQQQQKHQEASFENIFDDISMGLRSQASSSAAAAQSRRFPPPPPPPAGMRSNNRASQREESFQKEDNEDLPRRKDSTGESISSLSNKELSQIRRNRVGPPPRRGGGGGTAAASTAVAGALAAATGGAGGSEDSNESILGEASDIIARMESLTVGETAAVGSSRQRSRRQQQQQQQHQQQRMMDTGAGDAGDEDVARAAAEAAAEKRARHQRRKEKAERKAAKLRAHELRHQQQQQQQQRGRQEEDGSQTFTLPMNDVVSIASRGRAEGGREGRTDDILQAAAQIRARARRSTSRSRERVKEASFFCGEAPVDDSDNNDDAGDDHLSFSSEKRRSILNPLGLEGGQPRPLAVERRSQSRERRRSNDINNDQEEAPVVRERRGGSRGRKGRNRDREDYSDMLQNQQTTAEDLLTRRREMRQKIAERQHNATQSRKDHRRSGSSGEQAVDDQLSHLSLKEEVMEGWSRGETPPSLVAYTDNTGSATRSTTSRRSSRRTEESSEHTRRGRSRSAVRDGMSKIRSSSLFRKKGEKGGGTDAAEAGGVDAWVTEMSMEEKTMDSGKRSTSSFKRLLSRSKPRSRSRGRSSMSRSGNSLPNNNDDEPPANDHNQRRGSFRSNCEQGFGDLDARSASAKSEKSSSRSFGIFNKSSSKNKKKSKGGMGMVRSLSRGSFRNNGDDGSERQNSRGFDYDSYSWEVGSMRSSSSGKVPRGLSRGDVGEC